MRRYWRGQKSPDMSGCMVDGSQYELSEEIELDKNIRILSR